MNLKKKTTKPNTFQSSLREGLKYAQGKKAKVKVENISIKIKKQKSGLAQFFKDSPFHGVDLKLQRDKSLSRKTVL
ncbi:MAG TPA: hypothetical protein VN963_08210 [bacterium]|nr:hypothetical protein [bacterium]